LQPQVCGVQPQPPEVDEEVEAAVLFADFPALNTESCNVWCLLAQFGHSITWLEDITIRS
jgi:hypothetical protein